MRLQPLRDECCSCDSGVYKAPVSAGLTTSDSEFRSGTSVHSVQPLDFSCAVRYGFFVSVFEKVRKFHGGPTSPDRPSSVPCFPKPSLTSVLQTHSSSSLPILTPGECFLAAFLTGSALQTEMAVTHSKQTTGTFLTGARTAIKRIRFHGNFHVENHAAKSQRRRP